MLEHGAALAHWRARNASWNAASVQRTGTGAQCHVRLQRCATFKMMVLWGQEELVGPLQHSIIRTTYFHDPPDESKAFEQLPRHFVWPYIFCMAVVEILSFGVPEYIEPTIFGLFLPVSGIFNGNPWSLTDIFAWHHFLLTQHPL